LGFVRRKKIRNGASRRAAQRAECAFIDPILIGKIPDGAQSFLDELLRPAGYSDARKRLRGSHRKPRKMGTKEGPVDDMSPRPFPLLRKYHAQRACVPMRDADVS